MIVLWLMNVFGTIGHVDRSHLQGPQNRSCLSHCRWLVHKVRSMLSLVIHTTRVYLFDPTNFLSAPIRIFVKFEFLRDHIFGTKFAIFDVLCAHI